MASLLSINPCVALPCRTRVSSSSARFAGTRIATGQSMPILPELSRKFEPIVASRVCKFTGKRSNVKNLVSFSNRRVKSLQMVNLQYKKVWWEAGKRFVKLRLSTTALRNIEKNGLEAVCKKAGIDLNFQKCTKPRYEVKTKEVETEEVKTDDE